MSQLKKIMIIEKIVIIKKIVIIEKNCDYSKKL